MPKYLHNIDLNNNELQNAVCQNLASNPENVEKGFMYFNTTTNKFRVFNGTSWDEMGTGGGTVTSITAGSGLSGGTITSSGTISHDTPSGAATHSTAGFYKIKTDGFGHVNGVTSVAKSDITALGIPAQDTTYSDVTTTTHGLMTAADKVKLNGIAEGATANEGTVTQVTASGALSASPTTSGGSSYAISHSTGAGYNHIPTGGAANQYLKYSASGTAAWQSPDTSPTASSNNLITSGAVKSAIDALPSPMQFKGTLGTGGTITTLPAAAAANTGYTYKVITDGTYQSIAAKVGDMFISNGSAWTLVPSGDEPSGTVTNVATSGPITGGPITSTGTIGHADSGVTAGTYGSSSAQAPAFGGTASVPYATVNSTGHVTSAGTANVTIPGTSWRDATGAVGGLVNFGEGYFWDMLSHSLQFYQCRITPTTTNHKITVQPCADGAILVGYTAFDATTGEEVMIDCKASTSVNVNPGGSYGQLGYPGWSSFEFSTSEAPEHNINISCLFICMVDMWEPHALVG